MDYYGNNYYNNGGYQPQYGAAAPMVYANPAIYNPTAVPQNKPSLTPEEIKSLQTAAPNKLDISIDPIDQTRSRCNHRDVNGRDLVTQLSDGSGDVWCPICKYRWNPNDTAKETVAQTVDQLIGYMQNAKWVGDYTTELVRDYFPMIPLLEKFPDLYEYAMQKFNTYCSNNGMSPADTNSYAQYASLMGYSQPAYTYGAYPQYPQYPAQPAPNGQVYQQPPVQQATTVNPMQVGNVQYPQQPAQGYVNGQPVYNNQQPVYPQQPVYAQQPVYGNQQPAQGYVNGQPAYNNQQAPAMGNGQTAPGVGAPIQNMPSASQATTTYQPAQGQTQAVPDQKTTVSTDGRTVKSETTVTL